MSARRPFCISETCYRHRPKDVSANAEVANWLARPTQTYRSWGSRLCLPPYLRNVKGFTRNHKPAYRIYCELELNLRIRSRKRLVRERPESLAVLEAINQSWSLDVMQTSRLLVAYSAAPRDR